MIFFKEKKKNYIQNNHKDLKDEIIFPPELLEFLKSLEQTDDHPLFFAFEGFNLLKKEAKNDEELAIFLLEDLIFSSLYTTYYEQFFLELNKADLNLVSNFIQDYELKSSSREQTISIQVEAHTQYILNKGECEGCNVCSNHADLNHLLEKWNEGAIEYFMELYIGMQTIQSFFDQVLYDYLPYSPQIVRKLSLKTIDKMREDLIKMAKEDTGL